MFSLYLAAATIMMITTNKNRINPTLLPEELGVGVGVGFGFGFGPGAGFCSTLRGYP